MEIIDAPSPNFDQRPAGRAPDMLILHYTGMPTGEEALARMRDSVAKVSAHYMVGEDGKVWRLVDEAARAWHAGVAYWQGETDINGCSIGIELVNPGHECGYRPFPDAQIEALIALIEGIRTRHPIPDRRILGHSDVAPGRKQDPGELFPWQRLAEAGIGLWPGPFDDAPSSDDPTALQKDLAVLGYGLEVTGSLDAATGEVVTAFQRHWRQARIDGRADPQTRAVLKAVLKAAQSDGSSARNSSLV